MEGMSRQAPGSDGNVGAEQTQGKQSIAPDVETEPDIRTQTPHPHRQADLEEYNNDGMNEGESIFVCLDDTHAGEKKSVGPRCASDTLQSNMKTNRTPAVPRASRHAADGFGLTINDLRCYKSAAPPYGAQARVEWRHIFRGQTLVCDHGRSHNYYSSKSSCTKYCTAAVQLLLQYSITIVLLSRDFFYVSAVAP